MSDVIETMKSPRITRIEIQRIDWEIKDCGPGKHSPWMTYRPGMSLPMRKFMTRIYTDQGVDIREFEALPEIRICTLHIN